MKIIKSGGISESKIDHNEINEIKKVKAFIVINESLTFGPFSKMD